MNPDTIDRRTLLGRTGVAAGALALAGCTGTGDETDENDDETDENDDETDDATEEVDAVPEIIEVDDPPEAVYVPTHREAMRMLEPMEAGDLIVAPMLSYPHPFWIVTGGQGADSVERVDPEAGHGVHVMFTVWDRETGTVLPVDGGAQLRVVQDGERLGSPLSPWTMISQEMGFHFGDNVSLPGDGTYTVEVDLPPVSTRKTGALAERLDQGAGVEFEFVYDEAFREEVVGGVEYLDEELWGRRGALEPMDYGDHGGDEQGHDDGHDQADGDDDGHGDSQDDHRNDGSDHGVPYSQLPPVDAYPGPVLTEPGGDPPEETTDLPRSGDAAVLVTGFDADSRLAGDDPYLLVSPRTPYNRVPLADMAMQAAIERDGETVADPSLEQTLDDEYGLHYGAATGVQPGDSVTVTIESPPQVARHRGYETAFLEMAPLELTVPEER